MSQYAEIMIGPPGSGKSSYIDRKRTSLMHRNLYTINLDPGSESKDYDYSICSISTTLSYQKAAQVGPNMSSKEILKKFADQIDGFYVKHIEDRDNYFLFDVPGQVEHFICDGSLRNIIDYLRGKGLNLVVISLVDLVYFNSVHSILSSYLMSTICLGLLIAPQICVISKCDNIERVGFEFNIKDVANVGELVDKIVYGDDLSSIRNKGISSVKKTTNTSFSPKSFDCTKFYREIALFISMQGLLLYEILDYRNQLSVDYLQIAVDRATGYFYEEEYLDNEKWKKIVARDDVFDHYLDD